MYSKITEPILVMGENLMLAEMSEEQAKKQILELKSNPELAKEVAEAIKHIKPGQKPVVCASMSPAVKAVMIALMSIAGTVFADPTGMAQSELSKMIQSPNISVENVLKIENNANKIINKEIDTKVNEINELMAQKDKGKAVTMTVSIGGKNLSGTNELEAKVLQGMAKIDKIMKDQLNQGSLDKSDYTKKINDMTKSFERGTPLQLSMKA